MSDTEIIVPTQSDEEEIAYQNLVRKLDAEYPLVSSRGFDLSSIRGDFKGRTAKAIVVHLACHGWSISRIADALGVPSIRIGRYLTEALTEIVPWDDIEASRKMELAKLDAIEQMCHEQFVRSCEDEETITEEKKVMEGEDGEVIPFDVTKKVTKGQSGNPAYPRILAEISKRRSALLGLDKPTRVEMDKREQKLVVTEIVVKTRDDLQAAKAAGLLK